MRVAMVIGGNIGDKPVSVSNMFGNIGIETAVDVREKIPMVMTNLQGKTKEEDNKEEEESFKPRRQTRRPNSI